MSKQQFLSELAGGLKRFSKDDIESAISYYDELISDKVAFEGMSESEAVKSLGDANFNTNYSGAKAN